MSGRRRRSTENDDSENESENESSEDEVESLDNDDLSVKQTSEKDPGTTHNDIINDGEQQIEKSVVRQIDKKTIKKDPAVVPKSGRFFLHDDREEQNKSSQNKPRAGSSDRDQLKSNIGRTTKKDDAWSHDKFEEHESTDNRRKRNSGQPSVSIKDNGTKTFSGRGDQSPSPTKSPSKVSHEKRSSNLNETRGNSFRGSGPPRTAPESSAAAYVAAAHGGSNIKPTASDGRVHTTSHDGVSHSEHTDNSSPQRSKYTVSNGRVDRNSNDAHRNSARGHTGGAHRQDSQGGRHDVRNKDHTRNIESKTRPIVSDRERKHAEHSNQSAVSKKVDSSDLPPRSSPSTPVKGAPPGLETPLSATARSFQPTPTHASIATQGDSHSFVYQEQQFDQTGAAEYSTEYDQYSSAASASVGGGGMDMYSAEQYVQAAYLHQQQQQQQLALQMAQMGMSASPDMMLDAYGNAVPVIYGSGNYHQATVSNAGGYGDPYASSVDSGWYSSADMNQQQPQSGTVYYSAPHQQQQQQSGGYSTMYSSEQTTATSAVGASE